MDTQNFLPVEFEDYFGSRQAVLELICLQSSVICYAGAIREIMRAGIRLPVDLSTRPLKLEASIVPFLESLNVNLSKPLCFVVSYIPFDVLWK